MIVQALLYQYDGQQSLGDPAYGIVDAKVVASLASSAIPPAMLNITKMVKVPARLDTLPSELFLSILDYIDIDINDTTSLFALDATNWRLCHLSTDRIYSRIPAHAPERFCAL
jgi:hypothetical protein